STSQTGSHCGHCAQANRRSQARFLCVSCGYSAHADLNAAVNIARRAALLPPDAAALAGSLQAAGLLARAGYDVCLYLDSCASAQNGRTGPTRFLLSSWAGVLD